MTRHKKRGRGGGKAASQKPPAQATEPAAVAAVARAPSPSPAEPPAEQPPAQAPPPARQLRNRENIKPAAASAAPAPAKPAARAPNEAQTATAQAPAPAQSQADAALFSRVREPNKDARNLKAPATPPPPLPKKVAFELPFAPSKSRPQEGDNAGESEAEHAGEAEAAVPYSPPAHLGDDGTERVLEIFDALAKVQAEIAEHEQELDKYVQILGGKRDVLGAGAFRAVLKGRLKNHANALVAIKVIPPSAAELEKGIDARSLREAMLLHKCRHKNVVELKLVRYPNSLRRTIDFSNVTSTETMHILTFYAKPPPSFFPHDSDTIYLVQELHGTNLQKFAENKEPTDDDIESLLRQLAEVLDFLHSKGIIHRDIKPSNFLVKGLHLKVADFGLSRDKQIASEALSHGKLTAANPKNRISAAQALEHPYLGGNKATSSSAPEPPSPPAPIPVRLAPISTKLCDLVTQKFGFAKMHTPWRDNCFYVALCFITKELVSCIRERLSALKPGCVFTICGEDLPDALSGQMNVQGVTWRIAFGYFAAAIFYHFGDRLEKVVYKDGHCVRQHREGKVLEVTLKAATAEDTAPLLLVE
ncbi:kinase-like domain-containing protein [Hyaloraphidium curvatum]|nr:kinase-like domain-containing protein [Hyaloraphidium curvatum]